MILFALPQSPYCAKVRAVLALKNISFQEQEPAGGSYQTTDYQRLVAAGSVPAIQVDDWVLHDSQAIAEYLNEQFPDPPIWHHDAQIRARQRALVQYHDTKLEPAVRALIPFARQPDSEERRQQTGVVRDQLFDRLFRLEKLVDPGPWLGGDEISLVDLSFPATIQIGLDLLDHMEFSLKLPAKIQRWIDYASHHQIIEAEVARTRGAIALWLAGDGVMN